MPRIETASPAARHTAEPWQYGCTPHACNGLPYKVFVDGEEVASCGKEANARRMVAAVNACMGFPSEILEQGIVAALLQMLRDGQAFLQGLADNESLDLLKRNTAEKILERNRAVIAKATGSHSPAKRKPIVIEVRGGIVQEVLNVPPGFELEVIDYDIMEADGGAI